jgi:hypothetical protein
LSSTKILFLFFPFFFCGNHVVLKKSYLILCTPYSPGPLWNWNQTNPWYPRYTKCMMLFFKLSGIIYILKIYIINNIYRKQYTNVNNFFHFNTTNKHLAFHILLVLILNTYLIWMPRYETGSMSCLIFFLCTFHPSSLF